jgi:hypothetical protein
VAIQRFTGGPLGAKTEDVDSPLLAGPDWAPDSRTLEFPAGLGLGQAIGLGQCRLIEEPKSLASRPGQTLRYRNAGPGEWVYVAHD